MSNPLAIITGASRGIGRGIALKLAQESYDLVLTCRTNFKLLERLKEEVSVYGIDCTCHLLDASDYSANELFFKEKILPVYDRLDLVVNNAGISYVGLLTDMSAEEWRTLMSVNLDSLFNTCKFAVPYMVSQKSGVIINISSVWGKEGASCEVAYSASKGGVNSFTKALAKELAPSGIRVNAVACGAIDTDMNQWMTTEDKEDLSNEIGLGRLGTVDEVAEAVAFLASKKASYITGQILNVDGGF